MFPVAGSIAAFVEGFGTIMPHGKLMELFRPEELELLLVGMPELDFKALESSMEYDGGFTAESPSVQHFWAVVRELSNDERRLLLKFWSGSARAPIGGLGKLIDGIWIGILGLAFVLGLLFASNANQRSSDR